ncbi:MAG: hypothetical protein R3Y28_01125 [Candidatus Gastranaerophilales bacterium]
MKDNENLSETLGQVYDDVLKMKYVLNCAFYKSESSSETVVLGDLAINLIEKIIEDLTLVLGVFERDEAS